ncbi:pimeloyl-ACP methyl ester carboxylesterase [Herbihabitans rhizosphaerae]|uniref:Pimeloyl-ACP methyl ester carboxylesterase n=1 Tax=Herbihabitans rhizosphaerae TaxID=1872711 RepID=A0A4Q7KBG8_9PSEU|nr:alpha/beta hydrolase [Herbihabitans rhizosphaerae]RZS29683.1 pimeloyl-ACP methyl ester carboxylesterase [Herbihabitans rhizosphaerae]
MGTVRSSDGTTITYDKIGSGPPLILVDGALCYRASGPNGGLAAELADRFTVYTYDRRGRGESTDTAPFSREREIEDLAALIKEAGGSVHLYGISSGGALALEAVNAGLAVEKLALYEIPFVVDSSRAPIPADYESRMESLLAQDKRADTVKWFMRAGVGLPGFVVAMMRFMPAWSKLKGVAHTLPYDVAFVAPFEHGQPLPADRWTSSVPALVVCGGKSPAWMTAAMRQLAEVLPAATHRTLEGQTHIVKPAALAPVLAEFFGEGR